MKSNPNNPDSLMRLMHEVYSYVCTTGGVATCSIFGTFNTNDTTCSDVDECSTDNTCTDDRTFSYRDIRAI